MACYDARELHEIHSFLVEKRLSWRRYMLLRDLVQSSSAITLKDTAIWSGMSRKDVQRYLPLLRNFEDVHMSRFKGEIWLVYASEQEATLCKRRKISLMAHVRLRPYLEELCVDLKRYYERRLHQDWQTPVETMRELKQRWTETLNRELRSVITYRMKHPKVLGLFRTVQDLVLAELGIPRDVVDKWLAENGELDLDDTEPDEIYEMED